MPEDLQSDSLKTKPTKKKASVEEIDNHRLPVLMGDTPIVIDGRLKRIEDQVNSIVEKQRSGVSAEFNALMDGYVNKANESQEFKVKFEQINSQTEELKIEIRSLREDNKKFKADLEAAKEALRSSESDLQRSRKEAENTRMHSEEQISDLVEERERLKNKLKQLMDHKDKSATEYNDLKAELLEFKYKAKQLEQEKEVEIETARRSVRESSKMIDELKEKLDLRTREVEYKDALLNQLIKQVSTEDTFQDALGSSFAEAMKANPNQALPPMERPKSDIRIQEPSIDNGPSWGAFRK